MLLIRMVNAYGFHLGEASNSVIWQTEPVLLVLSLFLLRRLWETQAIRGTMALLT